MCSRLGGGRGGGGSGSDRLDLVASVEHTCEYSRLPRLSLLARLGLEDELTPLASSSSSSTSCVTSSRFLTVVDDGERLAPVRRRVLRRQGQIVDLYIHKCT